MWVAGADGCPAGWLVIFRSLEGYPPKAQIFKTFAELLATRPARIAVDIPIGLPRLSEPGGRKADTAARKLLGPHRGSSVFPAPSRATLTATTFQQACEIEKRNSRPSKKVSQQTYNILRKIHEVDIIAREQKEIIFECHPEVSFWIMNKETGLEFPKRKTPGLHERRCLLVRHGYSSEFVGKRIGSSKEHSWDDLIDACAAAWTAERIFKKEAARFPKTSDFDDCNLDMAIWA